MSEVVKRILPGTNKIKSDKMRLVYNDETLNSYQTGIYTIRVSLILIVHRQTPNCTYLKNSSRQIQLL